MSDIGDSSNMAATSFKAQFKAFSKFGDTKSDGRYITLTQSDKWMKQAKVVDGKKITTTDTGIYFKKFKYVSLFLHRNTMFFILPCVTYTSCTRHIDSCYIPVFAWLSKLYVTLAHLLSFLILILMATVGIEHGTLLITGR